MSGTIRAHAPAAALAALLGMATLPLPARAQLSPGKLSHAHVAIDTSGSCLQCHRAGKGVDRDRCLSCHTLLGGRIAARAGLHARAEYAPCETCHIEHHGREFELVWWGEEGMSAFDHIKTGHHLVGAHREARCRDCHQASKLEAPAPLVRVGKNLDRTFLGLTTVCAQCHADPHRGQFEATECADCHGEETWRPAVGFVHDATGFALTGGHDNVACERCHTTESLPDGATWTRYRAVATACASCHQDPHQGQLGGQCAGCHTATDWHQITPDRFDHDRTRFPLRNRHRTVACQGCHTTGATFCIVGFERCVTCHADAHAGQLQDRADGGACSACHDTRGFVPSQFTTADHQATGFPLDGKHRTTTCAACHAPIAISELVALGVTIPAPDAPQTVIGFRFGSTGCVDCHRDPHPAGTDNLAGTDGCAVCHNPESWQRVAFDHASTHFPLTGAHRPLDCSACHAASGQGTSEAEVRLHGVPTACRDCHHDPHAGQLSGPGPKASCADCHAVEGWIPTHFDHQRDASFPLEGAHARAPCAACHATESIAGRATVRYRPVPTACSACHRTGALP